MAVVRCYGDLIVEGHLTLCSSDDVVGDARLGVCDANRNSVGVNHEGSGVDLRQDIERFVREVQAPEGLGLRQSMLALAHVKYSMIDDVAFA